MIPRTAKSRHIPQVLLLLLAAFNLNAEDNTLVTLVLVGDSTVTGQHKKYTQAGWGWAMEDHANANLQIVNEAVAGRSSRSYRNEGYWERAVGHDTDWMMIQFGHNDMKKSPLHASDPETDFRDHLRQYIAEAKEKGIRPVLVTPVSRRIYENGKHKNLLAEYAIATRTVADETDTPCIDLNAYSAEAFSRMGPTAASAFGPPENPKDQTHFSETGSRIVATWVLVLMEQEVPELAAHFDVPRQLDAIPLP